MHAARGAPAARLQQQQHRQRAAALWSAAAGGRRRSPLAAAPAAAAGGRSRPRRSLPVAVVAASDEATSAPAAAATAASPPPAVTPVAPSRFDRTPWYQKNTEGWTSIETSADLARATHAARQSGRRILALDLYAPSCSACKSAWPAVSRLAREGSLPSDVLFAKLSIEADDARRLIKEQGVTGIPWVLVLDVGLGGKDAPPAPATETDEAVGLFKGLAATWLKKTFASGGSNGNKGGAAVVAAAAEAPAAAVAATTTAEEPAGGEQTQQQGSMLDACGAKLVMMQGASFKKVAILRGNLTAVSALLKKGEAVVVDPNGLVVVAGAAAAPSPSSAS